MEFIYNDIFRRHDTGAHPENVARLDFLKGIPQSELEDGSEYLELVHAGDYIADVRRTCRTGGGPLDGDTLVSPRSFDVAVAAVAATVKASRTNGFAMVRPPGHHAFIARASGFCLFNNVAIATAALVREGKRVMILDFDGHCGDGTEDIFYRWDTVLYCSLHQFPAFPFTGTADQIGEGRGRGFTVNVLLPPQSGDDLFWKGMELIMQIAEQFAPDSLAVSAGFDAHHADPLLNLRLSADTYYDLGRELGLAFPQMFAALEGGYNTAYLSQCVHNFKDGVNGDPLKFSEHRTDSMIQAVDEFDHRLFELEDKLKDFWKIS